MKPKLLIALSAFLGMLIAMDYYAAIAWTALQDTGGTDVVDVHALVDGSLFSAGSSDFMEEAESPGGFLARTKALGAYDGSRATPFGACDLGAGPACATPVSIRIQLVPASAVKLSASSTETVMALEVSASVFGDLRDAEYQKTSASLEMIETRLNDVSAVSQLMTSSGGHDLAALEAHAAREAVRRIGEVSNGVTLRSGSATERESPLSATRLAGIVLAVITVVVLAVWLYGFYMNRRWRFMALATTSFSAMVSLAALPGLTVTAPNGWGVEMDGVPWQIVAVLGLVTMVFGLTDAYLRPPRGYREEHLRSDRTRDIRPIQGRRRLKRPAQTTFF